MSTTKWAAFIKYPLTALRKAGCDPSVQELSREQQNALLAQITMSYAMQGKPIPEFLNAPKGRKKREAADPV